MAAGPASLHIACWRLPDVRRARLAYSREGTPRLVPAHRDSGRASHVIEAGREADGGQKGGVRARRTENVLFALGIRVSGKPRRFGNVCKSIVG
jgi:hypothetical protein